MDRGIALLLLGIFSSILISTGLAGDLHISENATARAFSGADFLGSMGNMENIDIINRYDAGYRSAAFTASLHTQVAGQT